MVEIQKILQERCQVLSAWRKKGFSVCIFPSRKERKAKGLFCSGARDVWSASY